MAWQGICVDGSRIEESRRKSRGEDMVDMGAYMEVVVVAKRYGSTTVLGYRPHVTSGIMSWRERGVKTNEEDTPSRRRSGGDMVAGVDEMVAHKGVRFRGANNGPTHCSRRRRLGPTSI